MSRPMLEVRALADGPPALRSAPHGAVVITGTVVTFNTPSQVLTGPRGVSFVEMVGPEAVAHIKERRDIKFCVGHELRKPYGSTRAGTLKLQPDARALRFELTPPNSPSGEDLIESIRRGDLDAMSFAFRILEDGEQWDREARPPLRRLTNIDIHEISAVAFAAYQDGTGISVETRAFDIAEQIIAADRQHERWSAVRALETRLRELR